ncbi:MAG: [FeFe] hydrogenase H-cluster maturation GTPase HydF [Schwartzia sp.]|nr:[FeFe] hydrogenase H-cluster maturation GTPase HydF [Schwartzia sp. (in: firmicutes)]
MNQAARGERIHIGVFGRRNAGKSSLLNALTGQQAALVSDVAGTTTDPVYQPMELHGAGAVVFIDTAGFDDTGTLGGMRVERTRAAAARTDIALVLFEEEDAADEAGENGAFRWAEKLRRAGTMVFPVVTKTDTRPEKGAVLAKTVEERLGVPAICVSAETGAGVDDLRAVLVRAIQQGDIQRSLLSGLAGEGDTVLLVMPQDAEAPKGRLIQPQVQTIRELLDVRCVAVGCMPDTMEAALAALKNPPALVITDSQVFAEVREKTPPESKLTSFSVLFAAYKGDIDYFRKSAEKLDGLPADARILIAEACTHNALDADIGRVKIPAMLRKKLGDGIKIEVVGGSDFPAELSGYDLIVHCGACMFNRRYVLSRVEAARAAGTPMTNYGILIAKLSGILDKVAFPIGRTRRL